MRIIFSRVASAADTEARAIHYSLQFLSRCTHALIVRHSSPSPLHTSAAIYGSVRVRSSAYEPRTAWDKFPMSSCTENGATNWDPCRLPNEETPAWNTLKLRQCENLPVSSRVEDTFGYTNLHLTLQNGLWLIYWLLAYYYNYFYQCFYYYQSLSSSLSLSLPSFYHQHFMLCAIGHYMYKCKKNLLFYNNV